jgi:hypothetical protein
MGVSSSGVDPRKGHERLKVTAPVCLLILQVTFDGDKAGIWFIFL